MSINNFVYFTYINLPIIVWIESSGLPKQGPTLKSMDEPNSFLFFFCRLIPDTMMKLAFHVPDFIILSRPKKGYRRFAFSPMELLIADSTCQIVY